MGKNIDGLQSESIMGKNYISAFEREIYGDFKRESWNKKHIKSNKGEVTHKDVEKITGYSKAHIIRLLKVNNVDQVLLMRKGKKHEKSVYGEITDNEIFKIINSCGSPELALKHLLSTKACIKNRLRKFALDTMHHRFKINVSRRGMAKLIVNKDVQP